MFNKIVGAVNQYLKSRYNLYGINFDTVISTDLEDLKQYTQNFNYRALYRNDDDVRMLSELQKKFSNTKDYSLLLYNYGIPKLNKTKFNQMDLTAFFKEDKPEPEFSKALIRGGVSSEIVGSLKAMKKNLNTSDDNAFTIRNVKLIDIEINYRLITPSQEFLDNFTTLYLTDIQRNLTIPVTIDFGGTIGKDTIEMQPEFSEIENWGLIDLQRAGDLKQCAFSVNVSAPLFSNFTEIVTGVKEITITLGVGKIQK